MIPRQQRDDFNLLRVESPEFPVFDQVIRVAVVPFVADVDARVVEQGAIFEPFPLPIAEFVHRARLIEDRQRELGDVARVGGRIVAPLAELDDAPAADIGNRSILRIVAVFRWM